MTIPHPLSVQGVEPAQRSGAALPVRSVPVMRLTQQVMPVLVLVELLVRQVQMVLLALGKRALMIPPVPVPLAERVQIARQVQIAPQVPIAQQTALKDSALPVSSR